MFLCLHQDSSPPSLLPHWLVCRTSSCPTSPRAVAHSKWRCSSIRSNVGPLLKAFIKAPCTPLHENIGEKDYSAVPNCCSFAQVFVCCLLMGLCCHSSELQWGQIQTAHGDWREDVGPAEFHTRCITSCRVHGCHKLPLLCQAEKPLAMESTSPLPSFIGSVCLLSAYPFSTADASSGASEPSSLSACAQGPQNNQVQGCTATHCGAEVGYSWKWRFCWAHNLPRARRCCCVENHL